MVTATFRFYELLKRREITHGCFVHARKSALQLREVFERLDLARSARPFTLCVHCNAPLRGVDKSLVQQRVPTPVFDCYERFSNCDVCGRIFWEGRHRQRMLAVLDGLVAS